MFFSIYLFFLLSYVQGTTATQLSAVDKASLGDLIKQIQEIISGLNGLVNGIIGDALSTLGNLVSTVVSIKEKFLDDGLELISNGVGDVLEFVANKTAQAAELGVDITKCLIGTNETLLGLVGGLTANLTECVTDTAGLVLDTVNAEIKNINDIVKSILAAPVKLSKCLISLRPITCVTNLLKDLKNMLFDLPGQIMEIVNDAVALVKNLPTSLLGCLHNITTSLQVKTEAMMKEIGTCVDDIISQSTTSGPTESTEAPTVAPTEAPTEAPTAEPTASTVVLRASLGELIDQVKEIIASLNNLVSGVIGDALQTLTGLVDTVKAIKEKYLDDGIALITNTVGNALGFIKNKTQQAIELGVDVTKCVVGREAQLEDLSAGLIVNLTDCITTTVSKVLVMVNADIIKINDIVSKVTNAPVNLAKCLISLRPISCLTNLLNDLTGVLTSAPKDILEIITNATDLVKSLPEELGGCLGNIGEQVAAQTDKIVQEVGDCVDDAISGSESF